MTQALGRPAGRGVASAIGFGVRMMLRRPWLSLSLLFTTTGQGILQGLIIYVLREVLVGFDRESHVAVNTLLLGGALIFFVWVLRAACTAGSDVLAAKLGHSVEVSLVNEVVAKLLTLPVRFFDKHSQGDLVLASFHDLRAIRQLTLDIGFLVQHASRLIGVTVVAFMLSPSLALIGLVLVPLGVAPAYWIGRRLTDASRRQRESVASLAGSFLEITAGIRAIKVNSHESGLLARARQTGAAFERAVVREAAARGTSRFLFESVSGLGLVAVLTFGGRDIANGTLQWQSLLALLISIVAVYGPMVGMLTIYSNIRVSLPNLDRIEQIMHTAPDIADAPDARPLTRSPETIELRDVSFAYDAEHCLSGISARVRRGETIGIVGPSGAGKSTLLSLLLRFYDPTDGSILFDGVDLRNLRHADLMRACALVQQEPFLFDDTIANNIRLGRPDASMEEIMAAAQAATLHDEIMEMELGYDTTVGKGVSGRGLSGGQKQRVSIAAALLKNAPLLFLDEATSSLDSVSEEKVQRAIERLMQGRTTFVIAHRLSTLRNADRILVLDQGRLVGLGPHQRLIEECDTYRTLWASQKAGLLRPVHEKSPAPPVLEAS